MTTANGADVFSRHPKVEERTVAGLVDDASLVLVWEKIARGAVEELVDYWKTNNKTVTDPTGDNRTFTGTYATISAGYREERDGTFSIVVSLLKNYDQAVDWTNARVVSGMDDSEGDTLLRVRLPSIDHDYVQAVASSLKSLKYTGAGSDLLTIAGKAYTGEWTALRADVSWDERGQGVVEMWLGDPDYVLSLVEDYGTLRAENRTYYFNLPKTEVPNILAAGEKHGFSVEVNFSNQSDAPGTVDVILISDGMRVDENGINQENIAFDFSEANSQSSILYGMSWRVDGKTWYFFNRTHDEVIILQEALDWTDNEVGISKRVDVRTNSKGNFDVTVNIQTKEVSTDIEYLLQGDFDTIDGVLLSITHPLSEAAEYTFAWFDVDESSSVTIINEKLSYAPAGYYVIQVSSRADSDGGLVDINWRIGTEGSTAFTTREDGLNVATPERNESRTMVVSLMNRTADPVYTAAAGWRIQGTRIERPDENASDYHYTLRFISTQEFVSREQDEGKDAHQLELLYPNRETEPTPSGLIGGYDIGSYLLQDAVNESPDETLGNYRFRYIREGTAEHTVGTFNYDGDAEELDVVLLNRGTAPLSEPAIDGYKITQKRVANPGQANPSYQYRLTKVQIDDDNPVYEEVGTVKSDEFEDTIEVYPNVDDDYLSVFLATLSTHADSDKVVRSLRSDYRGNGVNSIIRVVLTLPTVDKNAPISWIETQSQRKKGERLYNYSPQTQYYPIPKGYVVGTGITSFSLDPTATHTQVEGQRLVPISITIVPPKIITTKVKFKVWYEKGTYDTPPSLEGQTSVSSWYLYQTHSYRWFPIGYWRHEERIYEITESGV